MLNLHSMTGYGGGHAEGGNHSLQVEIKSVNNRFLTIRSRLPENLLRFEPVIENYLRQHLHRGSIACQVQVRRLDNLCGLSQKQLVETYHQLNQFAQQHDIPGQVDLTLLVSLPRLYESGCSEINEAEEVLNQGLLEALQKAVGALIDMRKREGESLQRELQSLLQELESHIRQVELLAEGLVLRHQDRFRQRLQNVLSNGEYDEVALAREIAVLADRADISEEIARLKSHLFQFSDLLKAQGPIGRKLDFLLQEINREINTIGSKSSEVELSQVVVTLKSISEKMREQVQNVE